MTTQFNRSIITSLLAVGLLSLAGFPKVHQPYAQDEWAKRAPGSLSGEIRVPKPGSDVPRQFFVEGIISGRARHLWLIERVGLLHWPKDPELQPSEGKWRGEVYEGGQPPEGRFDLLLVDISESVAAVFLKWLQDGHRTGNYPGLPFGSLGDVRILDTKNYRLSDR